MMSRKNSTFSTTRDMTDTKGTGMSTPPIKAPFPWFGGKAQAADIIWERLGDVPNYVEPFAGSLAVLLARPHDAPGIETVNDLDCYLANFWRAMTNDPEAVWKFADWPVNEADLIARHIWLINQTEFKSRMQADPDYYDVKIAGWWVWGICCWIGGGWCSGEGPWQEDGGKLVDMREGDKEDRRPGVHRKRPHLGDMGRGVHRKRPHLGNAGIGVHRKSTDGNPLAIIGERLRRVRVCCGDWLRVLGPTPTTKLGITGIVLDPPYAVEDRADLYSCEDKDIAHEVREWAIAHGDDPMVRIALCGYEGEHNMPESWEIYKWKAKGGYANLGNNQGKINCRRERIWFSPHCLKPNNNQLDLFDE